MPRAVSLLFIACMCCCQKCDNKTLSLPLRGQWSSKIGQSRCITAITGFFSGRLARYESFGSVRRMTLTCSHPPPAFRSLTPTIPYFAERTTQGAVANDMPGNRDSLSVVEPKARKACSK